MMDGDPDGSGLPDGAELLSDGTVRYPLAWPIAFQLAGVDQVLDEVIVRRKTMADNIAIKNKSNPVDVAMELLIRLCRLERKLVEQMDDVDSEAIGQIIESFTKPGRPTGSSVPAQ